MVCDTKQAKRFIWMQPHTESGPGLTFIEVSMMKTKQKAADVLLQLQNMLEPTTSSSACWHAVNWCMIPLDLTRSLTGLSVPTSAQLGSWLLPHSATTATGTIMASRDVAFLKYMIPWCRRPPHQAPPLAAALWVQSNNHT